MSGIMMCAFSLLAAGATAYGQAVISTRSGLVHFFEGAVSVSGQPLESHFGKFPAIPEGAELRTGQGRAEVLLTPGVFLRIGENSAIRMVATSLADTRVELLAGSAIVESAESAAGTSATLIYKDWNIRQAHEGSYRVDCDPPRLQVHGGAVEVWTVDAAPLSVAQGEGLPFEAVLVPESSAVEPHDSLHDWSEGRAQSISADNAIAADIQDPATMSSSYIPADAFTYFPLLGYSPMASSLGTYGGLYGSGLYQPGLYQPGFNSLYLPGYTHRPPLYLGLPVGGLGRTLYSPSRFSLPPRPIVPRGPVTRPIAPPPAIHPVGRGH